MSLFHPKKVWELGVSPPDISNEFKISEIQK